MVKTTVAPGIDWLEGFTSATASKYSSGRRAKYASRS
jgi:hypothetical protein